MRKIERFGEEGFYYRGPYGEWASDGKALVWSEERAGEKSVLEGGRKDWWQNVGKMLESLSFPYELKCEEFGVLVEVVGRGKDRLGNVVLYDGVRPYVYGVEGYDKEDRQVIGRAAAEGEEGAALVLPTWYLLKWAPEGEEFRYGERGIRYESRYDGKVYSVVLMGMEVKSEGIEGALEWAASAYESGGDE